MLNSLPKGLPVNMSASADFIAALRKKRLGNRDTLSPR